MKNRWKLVTFLGLVLLLVGSIVGCGESYTQEDLDAAYETGHTEGYDDGSHAGYEVGYGEGYEAGSLEGYKVGYTEGKAEGYEAGYNDGLGQAPEQAYQQHFEQGNTYLEQEEWYEAIAEYTKAIELTPEFAEAYANRGAACLELLKYDLSAGNESNYNRAIADCEKAIELDPLVKFNITLAEAYVQRGYYYFSRQKNDEAIADYTMAMKLDPLVIECQRLLDVYSRQADYLQYDYEAAIVYFTKAIELDPLVIECQRLLDEYFYRQLAEAYYGRGYDHWRHGGFPFDEAIADYTRAIELNPTNAEYYLSRAYIYETLADVYRDHGEVSKEVDSKNKAIADYKKAEELQAK